MRMALHALVRGERGLPQGVVEVPSTNGRLIRRYLALLVVVAALATGTPAVAATPDPTRIDPALLAQAKANPTATFSVIVRAAGASNKEHRSLRASKAIAKSKG